MASDQHTGQCSFFDFCHLRSNVLNSYCAKSPEPFNGSIDNLESNLDKTCRSTTKQLAPYILAIPWRNSIIQCVEYILSAVTKCYHRAPENWNDCEVFPFELWQSSQCRNRQEISVSWAVGANWVHQISESSGVQTHVHIHCPKSQPSSSWSWGIMKPRTDKTNIVF